MMIFSIVLILSGLGLCWKGIASFRYTTFLFIIDSPDWNERTVLASIFWFGAGLWVSLIGYILLAVVLLRMVK